MNSTFVIGNITHKPEAKTVNDKTVCAFTVAVNKRGRENASEFFRVSAWNKLGESCAKYLEKGRKVAVRGEVSARAYSGRDGEPRYSLEILADEVEFLSPPPPAQDAPQGYQRQTSPQQTQEDPWATATGEDFAPWEL